MHKMLILLPCCLLFTSVTHASVLDAGPRVGVLISPYHRNEKASNTASANLHITQQEGWHAGIFARVSLLSFYMQPEIILTKTKMKFSKSNETSWLSSTKLDIPAMVGFSLFSIARAQIGPVFSFLLEARKENNNIKKCYRSPTVGWQAGLGMDIWRIIIDLKYEGSLGKLSNSVTDINTNYRHASWILSIGMNIL